MQVSFPANRSRVCFRVGLRLFLLIFFAAGTFLSAREFTAPADSRQIIVVSTPRWDDDSGTLQRFARRDAAAPWRAIGDSVPVNVGRSGMAWGLGLHAMPSGGPRKIEGDGKAPAGVFRLPSAFGRDEKPTGVKLPYIRARSGVEAVDDPRSRFYNRIVDHARVAHIDWSSSEKMRTDGEGYLHGIVVAHNPRCIPGAGSCIFLHVWRGPGIGTAGCTTMTIPEIVALQSWLDPRARPVLMQALREFIPADLR